MRYFIAAGGDAGTVSCQAFVRIHGAPRLAFGSLVPDAVSAISEVRARTTDGVALPIKERTSFAEGTDHRPLRITDYEVKDPPEEMVIEYEVRPRLYVPQSFCGSKRNFGSLIKGEAVLPAPILLLRIEPIPTTLAVRVGTPSDIDAVTDLPDSPVQLQVDEMWQRSLLVGKFREQVIDSISCYMSKHCSNEVDVAVEQACKQMIEVLGAPRTPITLAVMSPNENRARLDTPTQAGIVAIDMAVPDAGSLRELVRNLVPAWFGRSRESMEQDPASTSWLLQALSEYLAWQCSGSLLSGRDQVRTSLFNTWTNEKDFAAMDLTHNSGSKLDRARRRIFGATILQWLEDRQGAAWFREAFKEWRGEDLPPVFGQLSPDVVQSLQDYVTAKNTRFPWEDSWYLDDQQTPAPLGRAPSDATPIRFLVTSDTQAFLETCGCKASQDGGDARRAARFELELEGCERSVILDLGNFAPLDKVHGAINNVLAQEGRLHARVMDLEGYDAACVGPNECFVSADYLASMMEGRQFSLLCTDVEKDGVRIGRESCILNKGPVSIGLVSTFDLLEHGHLRENNTREMGRIHWDESFANLKRTLEGLRPKVDLLVLCGWMSPLTIAQVCSFAIPPDLILVAGGGATGPIALGKIGHTIIAREVTGAFGYTLLDIAVDGERGRPPTVTDWKPAEVKSDGPSNPRVQALLDEFYDQLQGEKIAPDRRLGLWDEYTRDDFVGAQSCRACHEGEYRQWISTDHASAYATLTRVRRNNHPDCVICHVVGLGYETGFDMRRPDSMLAGVQCENCHGSGGAHVQAPVRMNIRRCPPRQKCLECHTSEHSESFDARFEEAYEKVQH